MAELVAGSTFQDALLGNLISPSRGIFVYSPVLVLAISGFALAIKIREGRALHLAFGLIVVMHWIAVSHFNMWWAGHSFGPRIMTNVVPLSLLFRRL